MYIFSIKFLQKLERKFKCYVYHFVRNFLLIIFIWPKFQWNKSIMNISYKVQRMHHSITVLKICFLYERACSDFLNLRKCEYRILSKCLKLVIINNFPIYVSYNSQKLEENIREGYQEIEIWHTLDVIFYSS